MSSGKFSSREGRVLRLTKPRFKGILRIIFSRITFIALMIILQVVILVMLYMIFEEYVANINSVMLVFSVLMVIYLYNSNMDSTSKLTWMMLIGLFPVPGAPTNRRMEPACFLFKDMTAICCRILRFTFFKP